MLKLIVFGGGGGSRGGASRGVAHRRSSYGACSREVLTAATVLARRLRVLLWRGDTVLRRLGEAYSGAVLHVVAVKLFSHTTLTFPILLLGMGINKTEVNLRRLLAAAPQQQNQAKLVHYVATLREQLEQLAEEKTPEGLPRISKATLNEYLEKVEAIASKLVNHVNDSQVSEKDFERSFVEGNPSEIEEKNLSPLSSGLRRRPVPTSSTEERAHELAETDNASPVKLDASAHAHIEKHRMLQEDLTDEMVVLAKQLKESSLMMSQSLQNTEKILDSTEKAIEHSLASTGRANVRATAIYSESSKTSCLTWLVMFVMTCVFVMVILLIRVT
ncbi:hypothetical protein PHAVU_003G139226 [Phaseolus vulgaris]